MQNFRRGADRDGCGFIHQQAQPGGAHAGAELGGVFKKVWPDIRTTHWFEKLPVQDRVTYKDRSDLAKSLVSKLKEDFQPDTPQTLDDVDKEIARYLAAAKRVESSDSYTNRVLADCFYQIFLFKLSGWLVKNPSATDAVAKRIEAILIPKPDVPAILRRYKGEDPGLDALQFDGAAIDPKHALLEQLKAAGVSEESVMAILFKAADSKTLALIEKPSVLQLLSRIAGTEAGFRALLGMTEYLRRGGSLDDQSLNDFGAFRKVMGKDTRAYAATWMGKSFLEMGTLQAIRDWHTGTTQVGIEARKAFFSRLFE